MIPRPWVFDAVLTVSLLAWSLAEVFGDQNSATVVGPAAAYAVAVAVASGLLLARRVCPERVVLGQSLVLGTQAAAFGGSESLGVVLALAAGLYALSAYGGRGRSWWVLPVCAFAVVHDLRDPAITALSAELGAVPFYGLLAGSWLLGQAVRSRRAYLSQVAVAMDLAVREHEQRAARTVAEERLRIARELHDVLAHSMTVMVRQVEAGTTRLDTDPARARVCFDAVASTGRESLTEVRQLVRLLRQETAAVGSPPQPSLQDLPALIEQVRDSGLHIELEPSGVLASVPAGPSMAAYRIVQEALTNSLRHGHARNARVMVACDGTSVTIDVQDDGGGSACDGDDHVGEGHGLAGMRERAALYDGVLAAAPEPGGGFRVRATLALQARA